MLIMSCFRNLVSYESCHFVFPNKSKKTLSGSILIIRASIFTFWNFFKHGQYCYIRKHYLGQGIIMKCLLFSCKHIGTVPVEEPLRLKGKLQCRAIRLIQWSIIIVHVLGPLSPKQGRPPPPPMPSNVPSLGEKVTSYPTIPMWPETHP